MPRTYAMEEEPMLRMRSWNAIALRGLAVGLLGLALLLPLSCARRSNELVVGVYGSLTGTSATFGISTKNGTELFFDNLNAAGGIAGLKVRSVVEDDQSKPEEAATAVTKLIDQDGVIAVLGEVASSRSMAAAPY